MRRLVRAEFLPEDDPYSRHIVVLFGSITQVNRALRRDCPTGHIDFNQQMLGHWRLYREPNGFEKDYICLIRGNAPPEARAAVIAHETLHLVSHVLRQVGVRLTVSSEEAYCYYQQWLMERIYRAIRGK